MLRIKNCFLPPASIKYHILLLCRCLLGWKNIFEYLCYRFIISLPPEPPRYNFELLRPWRRWNPNVDQWCVKYAPLVLHQSCYITRCRQENEPNMLGIHISKGLISILKKCNRYVTENCQLLKIIVYLQRLSFFGLLQ